MDKQQADAIADALLAPELEVQQAASRRRAAEANSLAWRRKVAWFALGGIAAGIVLAMLADARFTLGVVWGGVAGAAIGWLLLAWRRHRAVPSE